jgi:hypothetical protein
MDLSTDLDTPGRETQNKANPPNVDLTGARHDASETPTSSQSNHTLRGGDETPRALGGSDEVAGPKEGDKEDVVLVAQEEERPQRSKAQIALIMFSLAMGVLLVALDITIVTTALVRSLDKFLDFCS